MVLSPCENSTETPNPSIGCRDDGGCGKKRQQWTLSDNFIRTQLSGRCIDVNGADNPDLIDVWDCGHGGGTQAFVFTVTSAPSVYLHMSTLDLNEDFVFNATSGAIISLDTLACCQNKCLSPQ